MLPVWRPGFGGRQFWVESLLIRSSSPDPAPPVTDQLIAGSLVRWSGHQQCLVPDGDLTSLSTAGPLPRPPLGHRWVTGQYSSLRSSLGRRPGHRCLQTRRGAVSSRARADPRCRRPPAAAQRRHGGRAEFAELTRSLLTLPLRGGGERTPRPVRVSACRCRLTQRPCKCSVALGELHLADRSDETRNVNPTAWTVLEDL